MVKPSAHFTNALNREKERLQKRLTPIREKIAGLQGDEKAILSQIDDINRQLGADETPSTNETQLEKAA